MLNARERLRVEQALQSFACIEHASLAARLELGLATHLQGVFAAGLELLFR
ncbi:hypothetical protein D3C80_778380 [compost metagenome]